MKLKKNGKKVEQTVEAYGIARSCQCHTCYCDCHGSLGTQVDIPYGNQGGGHDSQRN